MCNLVTSYNRTDRIPEWVAEHINAGILEPDPGLVVVDINGELENGLDDGPERPDRCVKVSFPPIFKPVGLNFTSPFPHFFFDHRRKASFKEDVDIPRLFRAKLKDYIGTGYDRFVII